MIRADRQADGHGEANRLRDAAKAAKAVKFLFIPCLEGTERVSILHAVRTLELRMGGRLRPSPGLFTATKEPLYPLYRRQGGPHCRSGRM